jgi:hypothetical protein
VSFEQAYIPRCRSFEQEFGDPVEVLNRTKIPFVINLGYTGEI